jgi:Family of unknown function (DUF5343)
MMAEPNTAEPKPRATPPYLSYRTLRNFLDSLRSNGSIPGRIDRSVLKNLSGGAQSALIGALRFFDLIAVDTAPTPSLERLVRADVEGRREIMRELLRRHYPFLFPPAFSIDTATMRMLRETFDQAFGGGDTSRKAMIFFLAAAKDSGVALSPFVKVREVNRPMGAGKRRSSKGGDALPAPPIPPAAQKTVFETLIGILDPAHMDDDEQAAVWTLIKYLKKRGEVGGTT